MFQPSKEMYETIPRFLESAKEVKIDSVWSFDVSFAVVLVYARGTDEAGSAESL